MIFGYSLADYSVVLASQSPQRRDILNKLVRFVNQGLSFTVIPSNFPETIEKTMSPQEYVLMTAKGKSQEVWDRILFDNPLVIVADTIVALDGEILEKPRDCDHAREMLQSMVGKQHTVMTAVIIKTRKNCIEFIETTMVEFGPISDAWIGAYVQTGDPLNKAGAYGIQSLGGFMIKRIDGCFYNVVGFPMFRFCQELAVLLDKEKQ